MTIQLECPAGLPLPLADPARVKQVVINLLSNALRYTYEGSVTLQAWKQRQPGLCKGNRIPGIGIAEEEVASMCSKRFFGGGRNPLS